MRPVNNSEAKAAFLNTTFKYANRTVANWETLIDMARRISEAESVGYIIDPVSVEKAVKSVLGVD